MEPIAPSGPVLALLRAIAYTGFAYGLTKELARTAGWTLVDDELGLGYVRFSVRLGPTPETVRPLAVEVREGGQRPRAFVPLFYFDDYESEREEFDEAFRILSQQLAGTLGPPSESGSYNYPHRMDWSYFYSWWALPDATFVLGQDEFDIQFGMDVSLWVFPAGESVRLPVSGH